MQRLLGETDHVYSNPTINDPLFSQPRQLLVNLGEEEGEGEKEGKVEVEGGGKRRRKRRRRGRRRGRRRWRGGGRGGGGGEGGGEGGKKGKRSYDRYVTITCQTCDGHMSSMMGFAIW